MFIHYIFIISDLEVLAFNLIHWLTGSLPWVGQTDPRKVETMKVAYVKDLEQNTKNLPKPVQTFVKYSVELGFQDKPDYDKLRSLLTAEAKKASSGNPGPARRGKKVRSRAPIAAQDDSDSEEEIEPSPSSPPVSKRSKRSKTAVEEKENQSQTGKKSSKVVQADLGSEEDMFSPSPKKRLKAQDIGVQTSPAFVAASKAARVGKKAIDQSEYVNGAGQHLTPSNLRKTKKKSAAPAAALSTPEVKKKADKVSAGAASSPVVCDLPNPTPAMLAIMKKKQQAEAEKTASGKKRKK